MRTLSENIFSLDPSEALTFTRLNIGLRIHVAKRMSDGRFQQMTQIIPPIEQENAQVDLIQVKVDAMLNEVRQAASNAENVLTNSGTQTRTF